jgi:hypothetical protein
VVFPDRAIYAFFHEVHRDSICRHFAKVNNSRGGLKQCTAWRIKDRNLRKFMKNLDNTRDDIRLLIDRVRRKEVSRVNAARIDYSISSLSRKQKKQLFKGLSSLNQFFKKWTEKGQLIKVFLSVLDRNDPIMNEDPKYNSPYWQNIKKFTKPPYRGNYHREAHLHSELSGLPGDIEEIELRNKGIFKLKTRHELDNPKQNFEIYTDKMFNAVRCRFFNFDSDESRFDNPNRTSCFTDDLGLALDEI